MKRLACCLLTLPWLLGAGVESSAERDFRASDVAARLLALRQEITHVLDLGHDEVLVVDFNPKQGALSEWDDESRLVLYRRKGASFEREQWVSRAGASIPGRLSAIEALDLDGDGTPELVAIGFPHGLAGKVTSQVYRRAGANLRFEQVWMRRDRGAAFMLGAPGTGLRYVSLDPVTFAPRWERYTLVGSQLRLEGGHP